MIEVPITYPLTLKQWNFLKNQLYPGCTFLYCSKFSGLKTIATIRPNNNCDFKNNTQDYDIRRHGHGLLDNLSNFTHPNGSPILIKEVTQQEKIQNKIKTLWNNSNYVTTNPERAY